MHIILINNDLATPDDFKDAAKLLSTNATFFSYSEKKFSLRFIDNTLILNEDISINLSGITSVVAIAAGVVTLKIIYELLFFLKNKSSRDLFVGIKLPEYWLLNKVSNHDLFFQEAFRVYLSKSISLGYKNALVFSSSSPCAEFYSKNILGGVVPEISGIYEACAANGILKEMPMGIG